MSRGSIPGTVAVFALVGPALAVAALVLVMHGSAILAVPALFAMFLWMLPGGYLLGVGPGVMTGLVAVWLSPRVAQGWLWALTITGVGALAAAAAGYALDPEGRAIAPLRLLVLTVPAGVAAGLGCALICWAARLRPRSGE